MLEWLGLALVGCGGACVAGLIAAVVVFLAWRWWNARDDDPRYLADQQVPLRRWAQAVMGIYQGDCGDPAYWDGDDCRDVLKNGWSTDGRKELLDLLDRYHRGESNVSFDKARIVWLARLGVGSGALSAEESWEHVAQAYAALVPAVAGWKPFAGQVREGVYGWYGGEDKMPEKRRESLVAAMEWGLEHHGGSPWKVT